VSEVSPRPDGDPSRWADPSATYDMVAHRYAERFRSELDAKPFDRDLLARFAAAVAAGASGDGPICDLGCGPAHIGAFLREQGARVIGIDRSLGMVAQARLDNPSMAVCQGDMGALGLRQGALAGLACFYALIHVPRSQVPAVLGEMHRVLAVDGMLLLAVHGGEGALHATRMLELPVELDATLFSLPELLGLLEAAGFAAVEAHEREPYVNESATKRLYVWARRDT
jgi:SAM-dependent methyltransferase